MSKYGNLVEFTDEQLRAATQEPYSPHVQRLAQELLLERGSDDYRAGYEQGLALGKMSLKKETP